MSEPTVNPTFDQYAIVEIFGHDQYAGRVTTENIGGKSMIKIEVPEVLHEGHAMPTFVKYFSGDSIFSITPVSEEYANQMAIQLAKTPITGYNHSAVVRAMAEKVFSSMTLSQVQSMLKGKLMGEIANDIEEE